jgi:hypothetical protein
MTSEAEKSGLVVDRDATWWTPWTQQDAIHHEIRGLFLATTPTPRRWLLEEDSSCWKTHEFHSSALSYIMNSDNVNYAYKLARVSAALRRVNAEALVRAVYLALMA